MKLPAVKLKELSAPLLQWAEKAGLRARIEPQLAKYRAMEPEKKKQLLTAVVFGVIAANLLLVLAPILARSMDIFQKNQKIKSEVLLAREDIASREQTLKTRVTSEASLEQTHARIFKSDQVHLFLDVLSGMARESHVNIESFTPITVKSRREDLPYPIPKGYSLVGFELIGMAGFHELGDLIARLESSLAFVRVESVEVLHELASERRVHQVTLRFITIRRD